MVRLPPPPPCPECGVVDWFAPEQASIGQIGVECLNCGHRDRIELVGRTLRVVDVGDAV